MESSPRPEGFAKGKRSARKPRGERLALEQLEDEVVPRALPPHVVESAHVRVRESGYRTGLALEPQPQLLVLGHARGEDLERDRPAQASVAGAPHLAHPTRAEEREDLVRSEARARSQLHGSKLTLTSVDSIARR
jgi:hypothetical protein